MKVVNGNSGDRQSSNKASSVSCTTPNAGVTASSSAVTPSEVAAIAIKQKWLENHVLSNKHKEIDSNDAVVQKLMIYYLLKTFSDWALIITAEYLNHVCKQIQNCSCFPPIQNVNYYENAAFSVMSER